MDNRKQDLAIMIINMKYSALLAANDYDADKATAELQNDLQKFDETFGFKLTRDNAYSNTWGIYQYGIFKNMNEFLEVSENWPY